MTRKTLTLAVAVCVLGFAVVAGAAAVKETLMPYDNPVIGIAEPGASGHIVLNYAKGADKTEVQINVKGLSEAGEYTAYLTAAGWHSIGTFAVKPNGHGSLHVTLDGDHSSHFPAAINNPDGYTVLIAP